jgi:hypothetical protein
MSSLSLHYRWFEFRNDSAEQIPAFGVVRLTGVVVLEPGRVALTADQPDTFGCQHRCAINGPVPVNAGKLGTLTREPLVPALFDSSDGTPSAGESWGPRAGTWMLKKNTGGFTVVGVTNAAAGLVLVEPAPMLAFLGKTDAALAKGATGSISIFSGATIGAETDTDFNMIGVYNRFSDVESGKWVRCGWNDDSARWELVAAEC